MSATKLNAAMSPMSFLLDVNRSDGPPSSTLPWMLFITTACQLQQHIVIIYHNTPSLLWCFSSLIYSIVVSCLHVLFARQLFLILEQNIISVSIVIIQQQRHWPISSCVHKMTPADALTRMGKLPLTNTHKNSAMTTLIPRRSDSCSSLRHSISCLRLWLNGARP